MAVSSQHRLYKKYKCAWKKCRDAYEGELHVKELREEYLPPTVGMQQWKTDEEQKQRYCSYIERAEFPHKMSNMVRVALGILWGKDATIELPKRMKYLINRATYSGQTLQDFMAKVNFEQLLVGRCGFLIDLPSKGPRGVPKPYLCLYTTEYIINWDEGERTADGYQLLRLVVLDETEEVMGDDFEATEVVKHRVLSLGSVSSPAPGGVYKNGQFLNEAFDESEMRTPTILSSPLPFLPFYFVNSEDTEVTPGPPPYLELALKCFSLYRNSADHEQQLHDQSQETLVIEGGDPDKKYAIGSGATLTPEAGSKAYWIGINAAGLAEMRAHVANKTNDSDRLGGQMIDTRSLQRESGESLKTRLASQTATLSSVAETCGEAITKALRDLAVALGEDPEEVVVRPNTNFVNPELFAKTLVELMQAKNMGYPITDEDLHRMARERGISTTDFETAMTLLKGEPPAIMATGTPTSNPAGKTPKQLTPPAPAGGAVKSAANPTGTSARGKTRTTSKKNK
jgi:hypothetical protein